MSPDDLPLHTQTGPAAPLASAASDATRTQTPRPHAEPPPLFGDAPPGYAIEGELGRGGMGVVYKARQHGLNRPVALKMVLAAGAADPKALIRFLAEADAVAAVRHPNVVEVYAYGDHAGRPLLAMEFCPGGTLADRLKAGDRPDPRAAARLVAGIADGVGAAHALGIVHRDLKPHNVLLSAELGVRNAESKPDGGSAPDSALRTPHSALVPKVSDFGLAKRGTGQDLTHTGAVMGTPAYMSPEQAGGGGKFVGPPSDVWALGVMLYELLTGTRPFVADGTEELLAKVLNARPDPLRVRLPGVSRDLALIADKCLEKDPADRYGDAAELAADLRRFLAGEPTKARPVPAVVKAGKWAKRNKPLAGALAAAVLAMVVGTGVSVAFGVEARQEAGRADREARASVDAAGEAKRQEGIAVERASWAGLETARANQEREKAIATGDRLRVQLAETERLLDLGRLRAAQAAWDNNLIGVARHELFSVKPENRCLAWRLQAQRTDGAVFSMWGHRDWVLCVALTPDGERAVSGSRDGTARVWDARTGRLISELSGHKPAVICVAITPDGRRVVTGGSDGRARLWDAVSGRLLAEFHGHRGNVVGVAVTQDGEQVVTVSGDATARVWNVKTRENTVLYEGKDQLLCVAMTPEGTRAAIGERFGRVTVWNLSLRTMTAEFDLRDVSSLALSADGNRLVAAYAGKAVVCDVKSGQPGRDVCPPDGVGCVAMSADGGLVITGSGVAIKTWDSTGRLLSEYKNMGSLFSIATSADGSRIATGSDDNSVRVWKSNVGRLRYDEWRIERVAASGDGRRFAIGLNDGTVRVRDSTTGLRIAEFGGHTDKITSLSLSRDGRRVAAASEDGTIRVWDTVTEHQLLGLEGPVCHHLTMSPDGSVVALALRGDSKNAVHVRNIDTDQSRILTESLPDDLIFSLALSDGGSHLLIGTDDGTASVLDVLSGRLLKEFKGHGGPVWCATVSADGGRIVTGSGGNDNSARVWDTTTGQLIAELKGHSGEVFSATVTADGTRVVTGSNDGTVRVWDVSTGQSLCELKGHSGSISGIAVSPDGGRVVAVSEKGKVRVWNADRYEPHIEYKSIDRDVEAVEVTSNGEVVTARDDSGARLSWDARTGRRVNVVPESKDGTRTDTTADGRWRFVRIAWRRVLRVPLFVTDADAKARWWATVSSPDRTYDVDLSSFFIKFDATDARLATQMYKARAELLLATGNVQPAFWHLVAAEILRPKPAPPPESAPPPRPVK